MTAATVTTVPTIPSGKALPFLNSWIDAQEGMQSWIADLRSRGRARYQALGGVPTPKTEAWKYTNLTPLMTQPYQPVMRGDSFVALPMEGLLAVSGPRLVLINGRLAPNLSSFSLPDGVTAQPLTKALQNDGGRLRGLLLLPENAPAMAALNIAWLGDGLVVCFKSGVQIDAPLHIVLVSAPTADSTPALVHPTLMIMAGAGCRATLIESHIGLATALTNTVATLHIKPDATLVHVLAQSGVPDANVIGFTTAAVATRASYQRFVLTTGLGLVRNELSVSLAGTKAECRLHGIYTTDGSRHVDNTIVVDHVAPATTSRQMFKGVLDDAGRGVFQGRISVHARAQKSDGYQLHKALLLSPRAEVDCKPELEIYADDVKCGHGATVGQLDEEALFYLRSRGLNADTARALLIEAFLNDVVDAAAMDVPMLSEAAHAMVAVWLCGRLPVPAQG